jgi:hypothetical protein
MPLSKALFFLTAATTTLFVVTILAMIAMLVGDPDAPANLWFNKHGATVMTVEVILIGISGMSAIMTDRHETLKELKEKQDRQALNNPQADQTKNPLKP